MKINHIRGDLEIKLDNGGYLFIVFDDDKIHVYEDGSEVNNITKLTLDFEPNNWKVELKRLWMR